MSDASARARLSGRIGGAVAVAGFGAIQVVAFTAAYLIERPTWYGLFMVASATAVAYLVERGPSLRSAGELLGLQAGSLLAGYAVGALLLPFVVDGIGVVAAADPTGIGSFALGLLNAVSGTPAWYGYYVAAAILSTAGMLDDGGFTVAAATLGTVLLVALGLPLFLFVARQQPGIVVAKLFDPGVHRMLYLGVYGPLLAAMASLLLGVPLAYLLSKGFPGQPFVESLVDLPLVVPHSVAGIIILFGFGRGGAFPNVSVLGEMAGMVLAMAFVSAPYAMNATREAFESIDDRLSYASRIHGASEWDTFRRIVGPLAVRGMVTGGVLAWARAVSEFGAVAVVAYSVEFFYPVAGETVTAQHAPVFVYNTYLQGGLDESGAVAFILLSVSALIFLVVRYLTDDGAAGGGVV